MRGVRGEPSGHLVQSREPRGLPVRGGCQAQGPSRRPRSAFHRLKTWAHLGFTTLDLAHTL